MEQNHFPDLTSFTRYSKCTLPNALNVGWLSPHTPFSQGASPSEFVAHLKALLCNEVDRTRVGIVLRGSACTCAFGCPDVLLKCRKRLINPAGYDEVWIPAVDKVYVSPGHILHYVEVHRYKPPDEFVSAVMKVNEDTRFIAEVYKVQAQRYVNSGKIWTDQELIDLHWVEPDELPIWQVLPQVAPSARNDGISNTRDDFA